MTEDRKVTILKKEYMRNINNINKRTAININGIVIRARVVLTATQNYWDTLNIQDIDNMIYDKNDDINYQGYVTYVPILSSPDSRTPTP